MTAPPRLKDACRWICFFTPVEGFEVATHGGTLFVVLYEGKPYAITVKHNVHDFRWQDLIITKDRTSNVSAFLRAISYPSSGFGHAEGTDLLDIAIVEFTDEVTAEFFHSAAYDLDRMPVCVSRPGDDLTVYGALTAPSGIDGMNVFTQYAELGFKDVGPNSHDVTLRTAHARWINPEVDHLGGLSGSPVYNATQDGLCGMMVRGGMPEKGRAMMSYIDISDIARILHSVHEGQRRGFYRKIVTHLGCD